MTADLFLAALAGGLTTAVPAIAAAALAITKARREGRKADRTDALAEWRELNERAEARISALEARVQRQADQLDSLRDALAKAVAHIRILEAMCDAAHMPRPTFDGSALHPALADPGPPSGRPAAPKE